MCVCAFRTCEQRDQNTGDTLERKFKNEIFLYDRNSYTSTVLSSNSIAKSYLSKSYLTPRKL